MREFIVDNFLVGLVKANLPELCANQKAGAAA
ncbi:hypothetical protein L462_02714 [Enterobacter sp. BIDMC 26]|nr:hypothetical protein L462_02714 [Enterobacter sp. BIDMC 26]